VYGYLQFLLFKNFEFRNRKRPRERHASSFIFLLFVIYRSQSDPYGRLSLKVKRGYRFSALVTSPYARYLDFQRRGEGEFLSFLDFCCFFLYLPVLE